MDDTLAITSRLAPQAIDTLILDGLRSLNGPIPLDDLADSLGLRDVTDGCERHDSLYRLERAGLIIRTRGFQTDPRLPRFECQTTIYEAAAREVSLGDR